MPVWGGSFLPWSTDSADEVEEPIAAIHTENNFFTADGVTPANFIARFNGTAIHATSTFVNGKAKANQLDVVAAYNAVNDPDLSPTVGWTPTLYTEIHPTQAVPGLVLGNAGPFKEE